MGSICSTGGQQLTAPKPATSDQSAQTSPESDPNSPRPSSPSNPSNPSNPHAPISKAKSSILSFFISKFHKQHKATLRPFWSRWKNFHEIELSELPALEDLEDFQEEDHPEVRIDKSNLAEANNKLNLENLQMLKACPLFPYASRDNSEQTIPVSFLVRFFEEMMEKKHEADLASLQSARPLTSVPDFFLDHLIRVYGLKKLAQKSMWQILKTLELLQSQGHAYGRIMCRMLQIFDSQPIPTSLAWFLTKARAEFNKLLYVRKAVLRQRRIEEVHLVEAVNLVYALFESDKFSRAKAVSLLRPKATADEDFLLFKISNRAIRMGLTSEIMFAVLDADSSGAVGLKEFLEYLRRTLEIMVSDSEAAILREAFSLKLTGLVDKEAFLSRFQVKQFSEYSKNEDWVVSKANFLSVLIEVYKTIQLKDIAVLTSLFKQYKKTKLAQPDFKELLLKLDKRLHHEQVCDLYEEALMYNSDYSLDGVLLDSLIKVVFLYGIGKRGVRDFGMV